MKRLPTRSAIFAAESAVAQSRRDTVESLHRLRSALHSRLGRPSSLAIAAGLGFLVGLSLPSHAGSRQTPTGTKTSASVAALALPFLIRFGQRRVAEILQRLWASARERRPAATASQRRDTAGYRATGPVQ